MKLQPITILLVTVFFSISCGSRPESQVQGIQEEPDSDLNIEFVENKAENKVDVMVDGRLFTSYRWPGNVYKPILYPVVTSAGTEITRGFPLKPREGERSD